MLQLVETRKHQLPPGGAPDAACELLMPVSACGAVSVLRVDRLFIDSRSWSDSILDPWTWTLTEPWLKRTEPSTILGSTSLKVEVDSVAVVVLGVRISSSFVLFCPLRRYMIHQIADPSTLCALRSARKAPCPCGRVAHLDKSACLPRTSSVRQGLQHHGCRKGRLPSAPDSVG